MYDLNDTLQCYTGSTVPQRELLCLMINKVLMANDKCLSDQNKVTLVKLIYKYNMAMLHR